MLLRSVAGRPTRCRSKNANEQALTMTNRLMTIREDDGCSYPWLVDGDNDVAITKTSEQAVSIQW